MKYAFSTLRRLAIHRQHSQQKLANIKETFIGYQEMNRARRILHESGVKDESMCTLGPYYFVGNQKIDVVNDENYVVLRDKERNAEWLDFYSVEPDLQAVYLRVLDRLTKNADIEYQRRANEVLKFYNYAFENKMKQLVLWLDANKVQGRNLSDRLQKVLHLDETRFDMLFQK